VSVEPVVSAKYLSVPNDLTFPIKRNTSSLLPVAEEGVRDRKPLLPSNSPEPSMINPEEKDNMPGGIQCRI